MKQPKISQPEVHEVPEGWSEDMASAPTDRSLVRLSIAGQEVTAMWYITRQRDPVLRRWVSVGYWADPLTRERIYGKPTMWKMLDGFLTPGMVV